MLIAVSAFAIGFSLNAAAQTSSPADHSADGQGYSSSADYHAYLSTDALLGSASAAEPSGSPQYGGNRRSTSSYPSYESKWSHFAFEGGGGFTAPVSPTTWSQNALNKGDLSPDVGFGYNITIGGGWNFNKHFGALLEYQFNRQGIPNDYLNALDTASGLSPGTLGGNMNTWSFTVDPVYYIPFAPKSGFYVTGGGGFYRKVTNFTQDVSQCSFYYGCYGQPVTVSHFSSNQGGINGGAGVYHKFFGEDSNAKIYAEVRYVWVNSPVADKSNSYQGSGTEELIPVTFGIRF
ncbi:MAG: hypothetical protein ACLGXA_00480 [Acidobacteriota bacterium]